MDCAPHTVAPGRVGDAVAGVTGRWGCRRVSPGGCWSTSTEASRSATTGGADPAGDDRSAPLIEGGSADVDDVVPGPVRKATCRVVRCVAGPAGHFVARTAGMRLTEPPWPCSTATLDRRPVHQTGRQPRRHRPPPAGPGPLPRRLLPLPAGRGARARGRRTPPGSNKRSTHCWSPTSCCALRSSTPPPPTAPRPRPRPRQLLNRLSPATAPGVLTHRQTSNLSTNTPRRTSRPWRSLTWPG